MDALNNVDKLYQGKDAAEIIQSKVLQVYNLVSCYLLEIQRILSNLYNWKLNKTI